MRRLAVVVLVLGVAAVPHAHACGFTVEEWLDDVLDVEFSPDGERIVYWRTERRDGNDGFEGSIYTSDLDGSDEVCLTCGLEGAETTPVFSADGEKIAFVASYGKVDAGSGGGGPGGDIWVMNADGSQIRQVTFAFTSGGTNFRPRWSHAGRKLTWTLAPPGWFTWKLKVADFVDDPLGGRLENVRNVNQDVMDSPDDAAGPYFTEHPDSAWYETADWTPDDAGILFTGTTDNSWNFELYTIDIATGAKRRLTHHPELDESGHYSPDGSKIAFISSRDHPSVISLYEYPSWFLGLPPWADTYTIAAYAVLAWNQPVLSQGVDIYVMNADGTGVQRLTEFGPDVVGGGVPNWSPDGRTIATTAFFHGNVTETPRITTAPQRTGFHTYLVRLGC